MSRLRILAVSVLTVAMLATSIGPAAAIGLGISISLPEVDLAVDLDGLDISLGLDLSAEELAWGGGGPTATMAHVAEAIGADDLHTNGITGQGVGIAIIDTGVADVAGLEDTLRGPDLSLDAPVEGHYGVDDYGHGTHLAGLIASDRPDARGIAPDASLLSLKVGAGNGAVDVSQRVAAIDWVVQHRDEHVIRVLVLSYGTDGTQDPQLDPLSHAVEVAWDHGIAVVVAVGNHGQSSDPVVNPATNPNVIAVGAVDTRATTTTLDDRVPAFSAPGTPERRPDVFAPGVGIESLGAPGGYLDQTYPAARRDSQLFRGNGSSQAAAIVGGAAALLLQARPDLSPDDVKAVLARSATRLDNMLTGQGVIDLPRAVATPAVLTGQDHPASTGTGSLEGARGSTHLGEADDLLAGEVDVFGQPFDSSAWAQAATAGTSWQDGVWNGTRWAGTDWADGRLAAVPWDGSTWNGWSWHGWSWHGWSWHGWSWHGWSWHAQGWE